MSLGCDIAGNEHVHIDRGGIFGTMIFLYLMVCSIQKKMIANYVGALRSYGPLKYVTTSNVAIFCIFNTKTPMYQVIK